MENKPLFFARLLSLSFLQLKRRNANLFGRNRFSMQTNATASNSGWFRANSCEPSKHDWILMFTNWMLLQVTWQATDTFAWQQGGTRSELVAVLGVGSFGQMSENMVFRSHAAEW